MSLRIRKIGMKKCKNDIRKDETLSGKIYDSVEGVSAPKGKVIIKLLESQFTLKKKKKRARAHYPAKIESHILAKFIPDH